MTYILHGYVPSTCYQRVLITAAELDLPIECVTVDMSTGEHKGEAYTQRNPFGQVPAFEDTETGVQIFESRAICRYLAVKAQSGGLIPLNSESDYLASLGKFEQAASIESTIWEPLVGALVKEGLFKKPFGGGEPDKALMKHLENDLSLRLDVYERILSNQDFLAGDNISLADLFHIPPGRYIVRLGLGHLFESRPNVLRWWKSIVERPSVIKVMKDLEVDAFVDKLEGR